MNTLNKKELIIGIAMLGASLTYLVLAQQLPGHDGVDAATVPKLLAGFLSLLGLMQLSAPLPNPRLLPNPPPVRLLQRPKSQLLKLSSRRPSSRHSV